MSLRTNGSSITNVDHQMIVGIGTDIVEIDRIRGLLERHGDAFLERCFTPEERNFAARFRDPAVRYAGRWAAKEAVVKVLGTGFVKGITFQDIEVLPLHTGEPVVSLCGQAATRAASRQIGSVLISISHAQQFATATAIGIQSGAESPANVSRSSD